MKDKAEAKKQKKSKKELVLPEDDGDVEDREIEWLEYMLKKEKGGDGDLSDGLDGEIRRLSELTCRPPGLHRQNGARKASEG